MQHVKFTCCIFLYIVIIYFFVIFLIEMWLLQNVVLASVLQQSESAIIIHISSLFWICFPFIIEYSCAIHQFIICYLFYTQQYICQSQCPSPFLLPFLFDIQKLFLLYMSLFCFTNKSICIFSLDFIHDIIQYLFFFF